MLTAWGGLDRERERESSAGLRGEDIFFLKFVAAICPKGSTLAYNSQPEKLQISSSLSLQQPPLLDRPATPNPAADINV